METESHLFNPRHLTYTKNIIKICHIITPGHHKTLCVHSDISKKTAFGVLSPYATGCQCTCSQISDPWSVVKMQCQGLPYGNWTHYLVIDNLHQCSNQLSYGDCSAFELPEVFGLNSQPESLEIGLSKYFQLIDWCLTNKQTNQPINQLINQSTNQLINQHTVHVLYTYTVGIHLILYQK